MPDIADVTRRLVMEVYCYSECTPDQADAEIIEEPAEPAAIATCGIYSHSIWGGNTKSLLLTLTVSLMMLHHQLPVQLKLSWKIIVYLVLGQT